MSDLIISLIILIFFASTFLAIIWSCIGLNNLKDSPDYFSIMVIAPPAWGQKWGKILELIDVAHHGWATEKIFEFQGVESAILSQTNHN